MIIYILLILIIYIFGIGVVQKNKYINGLWSATDAEYMKTSGINKMVLFMDHTSGYLLPVYDCVLLIDDGHPYKFTIRSSLFGSYNVEPGAPELWKNIKLQLDINAGHLRIKSADNTLLAKLTKQYL